MLGLAIRAAMKLSVDTSYLVCGVLPIRFAILLYRTQLLLAMTDDDSWVDFAAGGGKRSFYNASEVGNQCT